MNIMTVVILALLVLNAVWGYRRGLVGKMSGLIALCISSVIVSAILPTVTGILKEQTPVYGWITQQCMTTVSSMAAKAVSSQAVEDAKNSAGSRLGREEIRDVMNQYGLDGSRLDGMTDEMIEEFVETDLREYLEQIGVGGLLGTGGVEISDSIKALNTLTKNEQTRLIRNLPVPDFLKRLILSYNNSEGYGKLQAANFGEYLIHFVADLILNILAFVVTLLVAQIIVMGVLTALNLFARLPFINSVNHLGGLAIGIVQGVVLVWLIFLVISMLSGTQIGITLMDMIDESALLRPLYQSNVFLKIVTGAVERIIAGA